jgi:hypothetical protein
MPKLGITDKSPVSDSGVPYLASSAGIMNGTELMKLNALEVTTSATATIDQRVTAPTASDDIKQCLHTRQ